MLRLAIGSRQVRTTNELRQRNGTAPLLEQPLGDFYALSAAYTGALNKACDSRKDLGTRQFVSFEANSIRRNKGALQ